MVTFLSAVGHFNFPE